MHYKNGTEAKAGDLVLKTELSGTASKFGTQTCGILTGAQSQSTTCNGFVQPVAQRRMSELGWGPWMPVVPTANDWSVTLSQCEKIDTLPAPPVVNVDLEPEKTAVPAA